MQQQRKVVVSHLEAFDFPQMNPNCIERRDTTAATQALHLMNNGMVQRLADDFARRVRREAGADPPRQVERTYLIALGRLPTEDEMKLGLTALANLAGRWAREGNSDPAHQSLATYCHAIANSAAFLYID